MLSSTLVNANVQIAASLPARICQRGTGLTNSGSSDWRSRSPAVVSIASDMPPMNAPRMKKYGSIANTGPLRVCAVD